MFLAIITYKYIRLTWEVMASVNCMLCAYLVISLLLLLAYNEAINFFLILYILVITSIIRLTWHYFWFWNPVTQMLPSHPGNSMDNMSQNAFNNTDELHKISLKMLCYFLLQDAPWFVCRTYKPIFCIAIRKELKQHEQFWFQLSEQKSVNYGSRFEIEEVH